MKIQSSHKVIVFAMTLAFVVPQILRAAAPSPTPSDTQRPATHQGVISHQAQQQFDNRLDSIFNDTFRDFGD